LGQSDLVIEAADRTRKQLNRRFFEDLDPPSSSRTKSYIEHVLDSITKTRKVARDRPEKFMGLSLYKRTPVPVMQLVELIRGIANG